MIRNSELEYSILFEDTQILDVDIRIERSLLGREVVIRRPRRGRRPRSSSWPIRASSSCAKPLVKE